MILPTLKKNLLTPKINPGYAIENLSNFFLGHPVEIEKKLKLGFEPDKWVNLETLFFNILISFQYVLSYTYRKNFGMKGLDLIM